MSRAPTRARAGLALPLLFALMALALFLGLGTWQLDRKAWKEALIATLTERTSAAPVELRALGDPDALTPDQDEFRRVKLTAEFPPVHQALLYANGSALRPELKGAGYFVFAPARTAAGTQVVVNRGFTAEPKALAAARAAPGGTIELVGALRWPETASWFVREYSATDDTWFARDHLGMALQYSWGRVAPFYLELESPEPGDGVPKPGPLTVHLRNEHLQYAITWFGLAAVVVVMFGFWLRARRSKPDSAG